ncbi:Outer membrane protein beta-barrel domain-containing protein [Winogradskyella sediminis]|uniref:Outer membrane protein beta-barrel domain-containing protein n=2 Tax=Winogradskyella sediminis TaxID=1382466 RepID=A0A1H1PRN3_9FLAO|nr:Outer membrane protein beta-barrel domain-containing protein [Winogradskyella sediminis]
MSKTCHKPWESQQFIQHLKHNMKHLFFLFVFLVTFQQSSAQLFTKEKVTNPVDNIDQKFLTWGYFLGFNQYDFNFDYNENLEDILVDNTFGFHLGLIGDMRINNFINLRLEPGVFFTTRNIVYDESYFQGTDFNDSDLLREVKSTYVHIPLLVKFSTKRINNFKPFIVGGVSTAINLSSNEDNPDDNSSGEFRMIKNTYFYEIGFGIDFYLLHFKFTPSIRGVFSMNNEIVKDVDPNSPWTGNISKMQTRGVFINFTFQ